MENFYLGFFEDVSEYSVEALCRQAGYAVECGAENLNIFFSSEKGELRPAFTAYNFLRQLPLTIKICNMGGVGPAGSVIYMAGQVRVAMPQAKFLLEAPDGPADGGLDFDIRRYLGIYQGVAGQAAQGLELEACLRGGPTKIFDRQEALRLGLITSLIDPKPFPKGTKMHWCDAD